MTDDFYRTFEERFRGSRELIKSRLRVYLPFVRPILDFYPGARAIDLGCGRGEWLELVKEIGFESHGVDKDQAMISVCKERGLDVNEMDALTFLRNLPDESHAVVTGFHIAEHLAFDCLQDLVKEAFRVLAPGGVFILETPNPENLTVGACSFYLDPTHNKPIPPQLLGFLFEYVGFDRVKVLRLHEQSGIINSPSLDLIRVINGASPDYAVVAQRSGGMELLERLNHAFDADYGVTMSALAEKYQSQIEGRLRGFDKLMGNALEIVRTSQVQIQLMQERSERAEAQAAQCISELGDKSIALDVAQKELQRINQFNHHHWLLSEHRQAELEGIYKSLSWRLTRPLRVGKRLCSEFMARIMRLTINNGRRLIRELPFLKGLVLRASRESPFFMRIISRYSDAPVDVSGSMASRAASFDELVSVRIMVAASNFNVENGDDSVFFLK